MAFWTMWPTTRASFSRSARTLMSRARMLSVGFRLKAFLERMTSSSRSARGISLLLAASGLSRSLISMRFIRATELSIVASMSSWNSGLCLCRSALASRSESCATRFLMSCTTKAAARLNDSNWRATVSASASRAWAMWALAWRAAVFSRSLTSQSKVTLPSESASTMTPIRFSCQNRGITSQARASPASQAGGAASPSNSGCSSHSCRSSTQWLVARKTAKG